MIFQKIARLLKSEINGNSWHVGDLLPSEAELAVRYNVSRNTSKGKYEKNIVSLRCGHVNQYAG
ncbi:GntR family transcriptional regulator [Bacillus sp. HC-Mk]